MGNQFNKLVEVTTIKLSKLEIHRHVFVDGFGLCSDALVCVKCNYSKYPEVLPITTRILSKVIKNDGTYIHCEEFPFVRQLDHEVTFKSDLSKYTGYFDKSDNFVKGQFVSTYV